MSTRAAAGRRIGTINRELSVLRAAINAYADKHRGAPRPPILDLGNSGLMEWVSQDCSRRNPIAELLKRWPKTKIIVFGDSLNKPEMVMALRSGASGYLLKNMSLDALIHSLRLVLAGEVVFPTELAGQLVKEPLTAAGANLSLNHLDIDLSPREIQILRCLVAGHANKVIARELDITEGTVKVHIKRLLKKINARNRTQAAIWALNSGLQQQVA